MYSVHKPTYLGDYYIIPCELNIEQAQKSRKKNRLNYCVNNIAEICILYYVDGICLIIQQIIYNILLIKTPENKYLINTPENQTK